MNTKDLENYNFISDLFLTAAPEVPDAISSNAIEQKIINKQIHRRIKFEPKNNYKPLLTTAACFAVLIGIITLFNFFGVNADKAETFKNEQELSAFTADLGNGSSSELGAGSTFFPQTIHTEDDLKNIQNKITVNDKYIYYAYHDYESETDKDKIYIFSANGENPQFINIFDGFVPDNCEIVSICAYKNKLAVTVEEKMNAFTKTQIYDMTDPKKPVLTSEFIQDGGGATAYLLNNTLYIVTYYGTAHDNPKGITPTADTVETKPENIYHFENTEYLGYIVIGSINLKTEKRADETKAILGAYYETMISDGSIYLTDGNYENANYMKYDFKSGKAEFTAPEKINIDDGRTENIESNSVIIKMKNNRILLIKNTDVGTDTVLYNYKNSKNPIILDKAFLKGIYANYRLPKSTDENGLIFDYYKTDSEHRYYGAFEIRILDDKISTAEYISENDNITESDSCISVGDYIYSIYKPDESGTKIFSYKYR